MAMRIATGHWNPNLAFCSQAFSMVTAAGDWKDWSLPVTGTVDVSSETLAQFKPFRAAQTQR